MNNPTSSHMKALYALTLFVSILNSGFSQEKAPLEEAQKAAKMIIEGMGADAAKPFKIELDMEKPQVLKASHVAFLVLPAKSLSKESLGKVGKEPTPIGSLWMLKAVPAPEGKPVADDRLQHLTVENKDKTFNLTCYQLAVQKTSEDVMQLAVFSKDKKPVALVALIKSGASQELPIELDGRKQDDSTGVLTISVLGEYKSELVVAPEN